MILKQGHEYRAMPHDGKVIRRIYRGGRCYYIASPYSPEATQALKAAFQQYWTAIRDYGYAHPQLVPFINEDPMLIVSLVEVGKTRWLVGDGKAYVDSDVDLSITELPSVYIHFQYIKSTGSYDTIFGGWFSNTRNTGIWVNNKCIHSRWGNTSGTTYSQAPCLVGTEHTIYADMNKFQYDGSTIYSNIGNITYNGKNPIGATYRDAYYEIYGQFNFACLIIKDDDQPIREMYPFIRNGENGMLDILSGTFHPNANTQGAFTIQVTDKE